jgi:hypothetical protein
VLEEGEVGTGDEIVKRFGPRADERCADQCAPLPPRPSSRGARAGAADAPRYRLGIKLEAAGAAGTCLDRDTHIGDTVQASAPRGSFTVESAERPLVQASGGIGVTPVLAIVHALAAASITAGR